MSSDPVIVGPEALEARRRRIAGAQKQVAKERGKWIARRGYFYDLMRRALRFFVEPA